jgi:hypothetical protein
MNAATTSSYQVGHIHHELEQIVASLTSIWEEVHMQGVIPDEAVRAIEAAEREVEIARDSVRNHG